MGSEQPSFTDIEYGNRRRVSRREEFLDQMDATIPWTAWVAVIEPHYYDGKKGRKPKPLETMLRVACHEHGTGLTGFLPAAWDHLGCQSWDHPARRGGGSSVRSLTARVMSVDAEVVSGGIQGGRRG